MKFWYIMIINVFNKFVDSSFIFALLLCETKFTDWMMIEGSLVSFNYRVMAIDPHRPVIMQDEKGEDLLVQLFLMLHWFKEFNKSSDSNSHTVCVLVIDNVKSSSTALHLADEERKVHSHCGHEVGDKFEFNLINKRFKLLQLFLCKCRTLEPHWIVELWMSIMKRDCTVSAFIDTFI